MSFGDANSGNIEKMGIIPMAAVSDNLQTSALAMATVFRCYYHLPTINPTTLIAFFYSSVITHC